EKIYEALVKFSIRLSQYVTINHRRSGVRYGYFRLDAFGRIYNRVLEHILNPHQLRAVLRDLVRDNNLVGKKLGPGKDSVDNEDAADSEIAEEKEKEEEITQGEINAILTSEALNKVLTADQRDDIVARIGQVLPPKVQVRLRNRLFNEPNAPVSYPFLWDIPQHD